MTRGELKNLAKEQIRGNIGILFVCSLIIYMIQTAAYTITFGVGGFFISAPMSLSLCMIYLRLANGQAPKVENIFDGFELFGKSLWLNIITGFFIALWSMLFVIPGIVKTYSYSMAPYILADNPDWTAREALRESKRIMNGHKADLFVITLSFIPWQLLGLITFGLSYIYVSPYMNMTTVNFYNCIKSSQPYEESFTY